MTPYGRMKIGRNDRPIEQTVGAHARLLPLRRLVGGRAFSGSVSDRSPRLTVAIASVEDTVPGIWQKTSGPRRVA